MASHSYAWLVCCLAGLLGIAAAARWIVRDYARWTALGSGGLPHSVPGWLMMSCLRLLKRDGRRWTRLASSMASDDAAYLGILMRRQGRRPDVAPHPIPQRQLTDRISAEDLVRLQHLFSREVESHPAVLHVAQSFFEKHHDAITLKHPACGHVHALISHGEIAHIHPSDGSMHMVLSPCDAQVVLDRQWGELHSLAGLFNRLPVSYTFVYAPRSEADLKAIQQILSASVAFMTRRSPACSARPEKGAGPN